MGYLIYFAEERLWVVVNSLLYLCMSFFLLLLPHNAERSFENPDDMVGNTALIATCILLQVCWIAVIVFSPLQQLARRLGFVVLGVLTLVGLSEISKLDLHQYLRPPKVWDNL